QAVKVQRQRSLLRAPCNKPVAVAAPSMLRYSRLSRVVNSPLQMIGRKSGSAINQIDANPSKARSRRSSPGFVVRVGWSDGERTDTSGYCRCSHWPESLVYWKMMSSLIADGEVRGVPAELYNNTS